MGAISKRNTNRVLSTFGLVMINVIAVDSLRTLPIGAEYGLALIFFYLIAGIGFFIPIALVSAELATGWPNMGGLYVWITEAFGGRTGFFIIWLQWIYNVIWYPTILTFITATLIYLYDPALTEHKTLLLCSILILFWLTTLANCFGMRISGLISTLGALFGTLLPMLLIIGIGALWLVQGRPSHIHFSFHALIPGNEHHESMTLFIGIVFGLIGLEMSAIHAEEVKNPAKDYPRALLISSIIILLTLMLSSLAIAIVVPHDVIGLHTGLIQAFDAFFKAYNIPWMRNIMAYLIVLGSLSCVSAWVIGPTKALWAAKQDRCIPPLLQKMTKRHVPVNILILQGIIFTILSSIFILMPNINASYWLLSDLTAQLALVVYIALFAAAIRLRYKKPDIKRAFMIPGGKFGIWFVGCLGIVTCVSAMALGFIPPTQFELGSVWIYEGILLGGFVLFSLPPLLIYACRKAHW